MDYLKNTAKVLADNGTPLQWVTPDGCEITQKYVVLKDQKVRTFDNWMRRLRARTDKLSPSKNAGAAAPNVVHSLDASMLRMTAVQLGKRGITDMAFVHDSYAVHACHLDELNIVLRQVAVGMFKGDWLHDSFFEGLNWLVDDKFVIPKPPTQGTLDVESEIPRAIYFFS
jgi:DNA-directed RNA polymerase